MSSVTSNIEQYYRAQNTSLAVWALPILVFAVMADTDIADFFLPIRVPILPIPIFLVENNNIDPKILVSLYRRNMTIGIQINRFNTSYNTINIK